MHGSHLKCHRTLKRLAAEGLYQATFCKPILQILSDEIDTVKLQEFLEPEALTDVSNSLIDIESAILAIEDAVSLFPSSDIRETLKDSIRSIRKRIQSEVLDRLEQLSHKSSKSAEEPL